MGRNLTDLGTPDLAWSVFAGFADQAAQDPTSALYRRLVGEDHPWGLTEQLLASAVDALNIANWQRASGGKRKPKKPKPLARPGVNGSRVKAGGTTTLPISQARAMFEARNPAAHRQSSGAQAAM